MPKATRGPGRTDRFSSSIAARLSKLALALPFSLVAGADALADQTSCTTALVTSVIPVQQRQISALVTGMPRAAVRTLLGKPACSAVRGFPYDVFHLADGQTLWIAYHLGRVSWAYLDKDGEKLLVVGHLVAE